MSGSIENALLSLEGLSTGDAFGERFFGPAARQRIERKELPAGPWLWTDDTHMALSIVQVLLKHERIEPDALARGFARRYLEEPWRGYGGGARRLLEAIAAGAGWREAAPQLFEGGSYGNGGAMRAAPIGGYYAGDPARAAEEGFLSARVTHAHPEGQAGAAAVAAAAALAANPATRVQDQTDVPPTEADFLRRVLDYVPPGLTRSGIERSLDFPAEVFADPGQFDQAARLLGTGRQVSAQDTVPFCLWVAAYHLYDWEAALWQTVAGLGDRDTTCAIVGGIVALSARKLPETFLRRREPLPEGFPAML